MNLPAWVEDVIRKCPAPKTGRMNIALEFYKGGVTKLEIGPTMRCTPGETQDGVEIMKVWLRDE